MKAALQLRSLLYCKVCERFTWHHSDGKPWRLVDKSLLLWHCERCRATQSEDVP